MKIIFFTDVHGNQYAFDSFLTSISNLKYDYVVFGGDIFGYYYGQNRIINTLRRKRFVCLLGNHDQMFLELLEGKMELEYLIEKYGNSYLKVKESISKQNVIFIKKLKPSFTLEIDKLKICFVHGSLDDPLNGRIYPDTDIKDLTPYSEYDYVFFGHTHHEMIRKINNCIIANPGSLGQQRDGKGCKYLIFDTKQKSIEIKTIEYDVQPLIREIQKKDSGNMKERLIEVLLRKI